MSDQKVIFIGCNPSLKNADPEVPFKGTKSGAVLDKWILKLDLKPEQVLFMNLTKYATQSQKTLKKSDVNLNQFRFELGLKLISAYHGEEKAFGMIISAYQNAGKIYKEDIVPNKPEEVEADMKLIRETPFASIIALGKMADWGMKSTGLPFFELPHPSGLNHKLNDKEALEKMLADCKAWLYS